MEVSLSPSSTPGGSSRPVLAHTCNVNITGTVCLCSCTGMCKRTCVAEYHRVKAGSGLDVLMAIISSKTASDDHSAMIDNKCL